MKKLIPKILVAGFTFSFLFYAYEVHSEDWMNEPEIKAIRKIYQNVESDIKQAQLSPKALRCPSSEEAPIEAKVYENASGVIRKYEVSGGTEDSTAEASYYYDQKGVLRFTFQSLRAANGTHLETRVYFDLQGNVIHQDERLKKGPGWSGGLPEAIQNPRKHFNELCQ